MGDTFGCTAGERKEAPETSGTKVMPNPKANANGAGKPLLEDLEVLLEEEIMNFEKEGKEQGSSIQVFQGHLFLAMRTSLVCVFIASLVIVPHWNRALNAIPGGPAWMALIPGGVCLMVVFTVYKNLGGTMQLVWQGALGTFLACFWCHCMSAIMPSGAYGHHYNVYVINTVNIVSIALIYWLNVSKNVRTFFVSYHVFFVMALQTPTADPGYNTTWAIKWDSGATTTLFTALLGLAGAVLVILFPTPLRAHVQARSSALTSVAKMCDMADALFEYYKRKEPSVQIAQLETDALCLQTTVNGMRENIDMAWWEHFDIGDNGKIRYLLQRHVDMLSTLTDNVFAIQICISKEDFGPTHIRCMEKINGKVAALLGASRELLVQTTTSAGDGSIDKEEADGLRDLMQKTNNAIADLATTFNKTRRLMFPKDVINRDLQAESFFVYCLSIHARRAVDYTTEMLESPPQPISLPAQMLLAGKAVFDPTALKNASKLTSFAFRGSVEVLIGYYMGMYCFNFNASTACFVSLLLAEFTGSAMLKNLGRLQAVVLSAVVPHLIMRIQTYSCDPAVTCLKAFSIFVWETLTMYIYYGSASYGYIGLSCGAFALGTLVYPCQLPETGAQAAAEETAYSFLQYTKILQTTISVIIMMSVDSILSAGRASDLATQSLLRGLMSIDVWFQAVFMARESSSDIQGKFEGRQDFMRDQVFAHEVQIMFNGPRVPHYISKALNMAGTLGGEADKEPRYHRAVWPLPFFSRCVRIGHVLRANLNMTEQVLAGSNSDSLYTDVFGKIRESKAWQACQNDVTSTLGDAIFMVQEVLHNETQKPMPDISEKAASMEGADKLDAIDELFDTINKSGLKYPAADFAMTTLEEDVICRINVVLMLMEASVEDVAEMVKECLKMVG